MAKSTKELVADLITRYKIPVEEAEPFLIEGFEVDDISPGVSAPNTKDVKIIFKYFGQRDRIWYYKSRVVISETITRLS